MIRGPVWLFALGLALTGCSIDEPYDRQHYTLGNSGTGDPGSGDPTPGDAKTPHGTCGNGDLDGDEACDPALALSQTCESLGFASGILRCTSSCNLDTSACQALASCNNGVLDTLEVCEGYELRGETCASQGFTAGSLKCSPQCTFDTSECTRCGNGVIETGEICEGGQLGGRTCESELGEAWSGELACNESCTDVSTDDCFWGVDRDERCHNHPCREPYSCDLAHTEDDFTIEVCKARCDQPGTNDGCPAGEECFATEQLEMQPYGPASCFSLTDCDYDAGYDCYVTDDNYRCARPLSWCGTPVEWVTDYSSYAAIASAPVCNEITDHAMCRRPTGSNAARVVCQSTNTVIDTGVCVTVCENDAGQELNCGSGFDCVVPEVSYFFTLQVSLGGLGGYVSCDEGADCDADRGYRCIWFSEQDARLCSRPAKACVPI